MTDQDQLAEIRAQWFSDELHRPEYWADKASRDIPWLVGEVERLRGLLRRLEWAGGTFGDNRWCPACQASRGHDPDCWLAAETKNLP